MPASAFDSDFARLEAELRRLESEYNMFFAGQLPRPPWETRAAVERSVKRLERSIQIDGTSMDRFRFQTTQARYSTYADLWDRGLRAREEGRPGPFAARKHAGAQPEEAAGDRIVHVTLFSEPMKEIEKLKELYERLTDVRRELGVAQVPFHKFATLIRDQVKSLQERGAPEVAFRVAVHGGKVSLTARGMKGAKGD